MKKRIISGVLGLTMVALITGMGVSRVAAEPEAETAKEQESETQEAVSSEEETEDIVTEEKTDSEEITEENTEEETDTKEETNAEDVEAVSEEPEEDEAETEGMKIILENALTQEVVSVEVCSFAGDTYSENLLLNDKVIQAGEEMTIGIPEEFQDHELDLYNVRVVLNDGTAEDIPFVPLLENTRGTLYSENGMLLIRVRDERMEAEAEQVSEAEIRQRDAEASQAMAEALSAEIE